MQYKLLEMVLDQLAERWARQNFRVLWEPGYIKVDQSNLDEYCVLCRSGDIVGYTKWSEPSEYYPKALICDPIAPDQNPTEVIKSIQAVISNTTGVETCAGSRYETRFVTLDACLKGRWTLQCSSLLVKKIDVTQQFRTLFVVRELGFRKAQ